MKADAELRQAWLAQPDQPVNLIVRVRSGDMRALGDELSTLGVDVVRRYRLTRSLSVRCTGSKAVKLLDLPWVERVEADRPVKALRR
jgi:hypothetical protein